MKLILENRYASSWGSSELERAKFLFFFLGWRQLNHWTKGLEVKIAFIITHKEIA